MLKYNDTMCQERVAETFTQSYKEKKTDKKSKWCKTFEKYDSAAIWGRLFKIILTLYI